MAATLLGWTGLASDAQEVTASSRGLWWDYTLSARTAAGYKDNVTLAHLAPQASAFAESGLEFIVLRLPPEGWELNFFGTFEDRRFFSAPSVDKEQLSFAQTEASRRFGQWQAGLGVEYVYQDQFLDVSISETNLGAVQVQGHSLLGRPKIRREFTPAYWVELQTPVQRQILRSPLDNTWEAGPRISIGHNYGANSELSLSYEATHRLYDHDEEFSAEGESLAGTHRRTWTHRTEWTWRHHWDKAQHWDTTMRFTWKFNQDSGSGYFDYSSVQFSQQLRYKSKSWQASGRVRLAHYEYPVQTVGLDNPLHRQRQELFCTARVEKTLVKWLRVFAAYEREQVFSNLEAERFSVNTVSGGFFWDF